MKFPTAYTILFVISILVVILSKFNMIPEGRYDRVTEAGEIISGENLTEEQMTLRLAPGSYRTVPSQEKLSFFSVFVAPIKGFYSAKDIIVFVLILGGFINMAMASNSINAGIMSLVGNLRRRNLEAAIIPTMMIIFAIGGTTYGMGEETVGFYPVLVPIIMAMGFDRVTGVAMILLGAGIGVLCSTLNPFATGVASEAASISIGAGILLRSIMLIGGTIITIAYVMYYALAVKEDPKRSLYYAVDKGSVSHNKNMEKEMHVKMTLAQKIVLFLFSLAFLIMIYSVLPFSDWGIEVIPTLGWWFTELSALFFAFGILMGIAAGFSESKLVNTFLEGVKGIVEVALIIALARGISVLMSESGMSETILYWGESIASYGAGSKFSGVVFINITYFIHIFLSLFIPSSSGLAAFSVPIIAPLADFANVSRDLVVTAYQSANGLVNLFFPTSLAVVLLSAGRLPFPTWMTFVWKLLLILVLFTCIMLSLGVLFSL